ncbi:MAG: hypothetical protein JSV44_05655 [Candidatus Zixiibacteriota bacterium]|nr:MAG: hypothetical protein JSV44_05655 [candidate division Zixibacteria bacterium]
MSKSISHISAGTVISAAILLIAAVFTGCSPADRSKVRGGKEDATAIHLEPGKGDAYLFDVKIYREGRKKSTRLDVYRTNDSISYFARAYLGKGVMKGLVMRDSILVYFPTEKQYYSGRFSELINNGCAGRFNFEGLILDLFQITPVEITYATDNFYVNVVKESRDFCHYRLISTACDDAIELQYDLKDGRYIPYEVIYARNDGSFRFRAVRRTVRLNVKIPPEKYDIPIPLSSERIVP